MSSGADPSEASTSASPISNDLSSHQHPPALASAIKKRHRYYLSCAECRRLKLKCDRTWPCSSCRKRGCASICPSGTMKPAGRARKAQTEIILLLKRITELEAGLREVGAEDRIPPKLKLEIADKIRADEAEEGDGIDSDIGMVTGTEVDEKCDVDGGDGGDAIEGLLTGVGSLSIREEDGRTRFLGASAGSAYYAKDDDEWDSESDAETAYNNERFSSPETFQVTLYPFIQIGSAYPKNQEIERLRGFLPSRNEALRLAKNYWLYLSFMFEPLEESVFWDDYWVHSWTPDDIQGSKLACVFMILCLGSLFDPEAPSTANATAHHFFILANTTLSASRFLANNTIAAAQTLQLSANFLFNIHNLHEGGETFFPLLGMALRMVVTMGLHRDGSKWGITGPELDRRRLVFWELMTLERMQAFISGRPYMMSPKHYDTQFPSNAPPYQIEKWKLGVFLGKVIDEGFSVNIPKYSTIIALDQELRDQFQASPSHLRSGSLPVGAYVVKPTGAPVLPVPSRNLDGTLKQRQREHTLDMVFAQIFFYMHKPAFAQALLHYREEPLASPWADSVAAVSLETSVYMLAIAKSWIDLHPVLNPRWWHIFFHAFAASVAQSSLVIKSPGSMLSQHAWGQLNQAIDIFENAARGGAPVSMFVPRLHTLRDTAYIALQTSLAIPSDLGDPEADHAEFLAKGTDANLSVLGPTTRLSRKPLKKAVATAAPSAVTPPMVQPRPDLTMKSTFESTSSQQRYLQQNHTREGSLLSPQQQQQQQQQQYHQQQQHRLSLKNSPSDSTVFDRQSEYSPFDSPFIASPALDSGLSLPPPSSAISIHSSTSPSLIGFNNVHNNRSPGSNNDQHQAAAGFFSYGPNSGGPLLVAGGGVRNVQALEAGGGGAPLVDFGIQAASVPTWQPFMSTSVSMLDSLSASSSPSSYQQMTSTFGTSNQGMRNQDTPTLTSTNELGSEHAYSNISSTFGMTAPSMYTSIRQGMIDVPKSMVHHPVVSAASLSSSSTKTGPVHLPSIPLASISQSNFHHNAAAALAGSGFDGKFDGRRGSQGEWMWYDLLGQDS